ncbi:MAG: hypothetical protein RLZZ418_274 [Pseudomonadota bacterium]|jgi:hypothetical protein
MPHNVPTVNPTEIPLPPIVLTDKEGKLTPDGNDLIIRLINTINQLINTVNQLVDIVNTL